jgi:hypothetical protein
MMMEKLKNQKLEEDKANLRALEENQKRFTERLEDAERLKNEMRGELEQSR